MEGEKSKEEKEDYERLIKLMIRVDLAASKESDLNLQGNASIA